MSGHRIGVMYDRALPPQGLPEFARAAESAGVDELWVVEDLGYSGAVSAATAALAATSRVTVGIGIAPAPLRNPALLAMELAAIAEMFPRLERAPEHMFSAVGPQDTAKQAAARVRELWSAGADCVVLRPVGQDPPASSALRSPNCAEPGGARPEFHHEGRAPGGSGLVLCRGAGGSGRGGARGSPDLGCFRNGRQG